MQPEQPNTPSQDVPASDGANSEPISDEPKSGASWWSRLFSRGHGESESDGGESDNPSDTSAPAKQSQEELERRVQAETDRREAKRVADLRAQERRRLRDEDPWAYAEQERQAEQHSQADGALQNFLAGVGTEHDKASIDPVVELLPEAERQRILNMEGAGRGLNGRKLVVKEALKSLEKHWKAEGEKVAETKLRRNSAFRKQVLAEARGGFVEPDLLPAFGGSDNPADRKVSDILRGFYGVRGHNEAR